MNYARYIIKQMTSDANVGKSKIGWTPVNALFGSLLARPVDWLKNAFIFHPNVKVDTSPTDFGLPYEEVWFGGTDGQLLHGWYVPSVRKETAITNPLFIWFHGNAGNVGHRLAHLRLLREQVGGSHFVFDYQGFGKSRGKPSATGILDDGRAAIACAQQHGWMGERPTIYLGESLGAAIAVTLALETPPSHIILLAPFLSLRAMGEIRLPPLAFLVDRDFNTARLVARLTSPLLVIHGTADRTIPFRQGYTLYTLAPQPKRFYGIEGAAHTNLHEAGGERYIRVLREFLSHPEAGTGETIA